MLVACGPESIRASVTLRPFSKFSHIPQQGIPLLPSVLQTAGFRQPKMWPFCFVLRVSRRLIWGLVLILALWFLTWNNNSLSLGSLSLRPLSQGSLPRCSHSPVAEKVVIAVKTGATEAREKVPSLMQTSLRCAKHVVFFSDLAQDIGEYHLHDALESISPSVKESHEFEFYRKQQEAWTNNHSVDALKGAKDPKSPDNLAAWTLDKYKNMHILERTWELMPDMDWYVLIDADTYIVWSNLVRWLSSLDPARKGWFGSRVFLSNTEFTHGGSGVVLSKETVHDFAVIHNGTAAHWDPLIHNECCGDFMLSRALAGHKNTLTNVRPSMSGQNPAVMPFLNEYWCQPTVTMHHFTPSEMKRFSKFELGRSDQSVKTPISAV